MKNLLTFTVMAGLITLASTVQASFVEIDNFTDPSFGSVQTQSAGGITVDRTITNGVNSVQFSHSGAQFGVVDSPSAGGLPSIGTFTYTATNGTFQELFRADSGNPNSRADGISFGYTVFNFNSANTPDYSVRIFADGNEEYFGVLDAAANVFEYKVEGSELFNVNTISLQFERNTTAGGGFFSIGNNLSVTPEPSAAFLFGTLALGFVGRRRRQS